ncbi:hypothetical protein [Pseudalkalibacillus salsuginis]|uniref:hypothetical protein n=1 Tax=Pseudalkalibacillus salsuginis TaxID=2910972 RepID=UPI001F1F207A|nr:hypothetical protein [Pseudalkalibacillus salsuginis]MCF6408481.1 hypothetical protein [Pseudalkalibacillus salsuginis]
MMNSGLRGFGAGLIIASGILALVHFQGTDKLDSEANAESAEEITYSEVNTFLEKEGLVAIDQGKLDQLEGNQNTEDEKTAEEAPTEKPEEETVVKTTVVISKGTSTGQVTDYLESEKIIKSSDELLNYLRSNNLENKVRFGNYEVNSKMTIAEIAEVITSP